MSRIRSGVFATWASAWLTGAVSYDEVVARVTGTDLSHRVVGLPAGAGPGSIEAAGGAAGVPLGWTLSVLRDHSPAGVRVVLPAPGDPRGLPPAAPFSSDALTAGEAVVGAGIGLVPAVTRHGSAAGSAGVSVRWTAHRLGEIVLDPLAVPDAEQELATAVRAAATELAALDVANWRPEVAGDLARVRRGTVPDLPPGHDPRAVRLLAQADRVAAILDLAAADAPGGAVTAAEAAARDDALRPLTAAVRRARMAAYNAVASRHR